METFSALLAICAGNSPVTAEFLAQRPVTRSFDVFFDLLLNKRLSKQVVVRSMAFIHWGHLGSSAAEMPVKFQSNMIITTSNLKASNLHEIWREIILPLSE